MSLLPSWAGPCVVFLLSSDVVEVPVYSWSTSHGCALNTRSSAVGKKDAAWAERLESPCGSTLQSSGEYACAMCQAGLAVQARTIMGGLHLHLTDRHTVPGSQLLRNRETEGGAPPRGLCMRTLASSPLPATSLLGSCQWFFFLFYEKNHILILFSFNKTIGRFIWKKGYMERETPLFHFPSIWKRAYNPIS